MGKISGKEGRVLYGDAYTISAATHSNGVITITVGATSGLTEGDRIHISGVVGMTDINGSFKVESVEDGTTLTISKTTEQTYTSGGTFKKTCEITAWTMEKTGGEADVSDSNTADDAEYVIAGKIARSGTFEGFAYQGSNNKIPFHTLIDLELRESADRYHKGQAFTTQESTNVNVPGAEGVRVSTTWRGTGEWTETDDDI